MRYGVWYTARVRINVIHYQYFTVYGWVFYRHIFSLSILKPKALERRYGTGYRARIRHCLLRAAGCGARSRLAAQKTIVLCDCAPRRALSISKAWWPGRWVLPGLDNGSCLTVVAPCGPCVYSNGVCDIKPDFCAAIARRQPPA